MSSYFDMDSHVTREGIDLIDRWSRAVSKLEAAKNAVIKAECELSNATNALGKWLMPDDAKEGEVFCVWHGDSLIQAENKGNSRFAISVRKRGRSLT